MHIKETPTAETTHMYQHIKVPEGGQKITVNPDFSLNVPNNPIIPYIEGDGTGFDITPVMIKVVDAAVEKAYGGTKKIHWMEIYAGEKSTRRQIWWYTVLLAPVAIAPWYIGGTGWIYGMTAVTLSGLFLLLAWPVGARMCADEGDKMLPEKKLFKFSIYYLFALFAALVADRAFYGQGAFA